MPAAIQTPPTLLRVAAVAFLATALVSCRTSKAVVASTKVKPSDFLEHAAELKEDRNRSPFLGNWWTNDPKLISAAIALRKIYIPPVQIDEVRPMKNVLSKTEFTEERRRKKLDELAKFATEEFKKAFKAAKHTEHEIVDEAAPDALTLQLHILEFEPNAFTGFLARETVDLLTLPAVGDLISKPLRGVITLEGRLLEPKSGKPVFEFADREESKSIIILPVQETYPTGQARFAIREWARQFELLMRDDPGERAKDSSPIRLWAF